MDIKLIDQLYVKLKPEYKTKKEIYERIKRELSLEMQTDSIKRKHERYLKKKEKGKDKNSGQKILKQDTKNRTTGQNKKIEIQSEIISNRGRLQDKEIMELSGTPKTTYYRYKNELLEYMSKMSQELLEDAVKYAYPDKEHLIKRLLGERRNILITAISNIKKTPVDKDYQQGISKSIENINKVLDTIFKDMGILKYEDLLKYLEEEKEAVKQTKLSDILEEEK